MDRVNVGAAIENQLYDVRRSSDDRTMQRRAAGAIAARDERRICIEHRAHARDVAAFGGHMNRVVRSCVGRLDTAGVCARVLEQRGDRGVPAIVRHVDQRVAVEVGLIRLGPGVEQPPHRVKASITYGSAEFDHRAGIVTWAGGDRGDRGDRRGCDHAGAFPHATYATYDPYAPLSSTPPVFLCLLVLPQPVPQLSAGATR